MSFDINIYRDSNETEKVWQMKKMFIERYKDKYEEKRLLCLAQCYVNVETLGCRYSNEIMNQIKELTVDFESTFKERRDQLAKDKITLSNLRSDGKQKLNNKPQQQQQNQKEKIEKVNQQQPQQQKQHKLISKSQLQQSVEADKSKLEQEKPARNKIQILSKNNQPISGSQTKSNDLAAFFKPATSIYNTTTSASFSSTVQSSSGTSNQHKNTALMSLIKGGCLPAAPQSTTAEMSPAPSALPIPFGLEAKPQPVNKTPTVRRNLLLEVLGSANTAQQQTQQTPNQLFINLNKLNKLRDILKSDRAALVENDEKEEEENIVEFLENVCKTNAIKLNYLQFCCDVEEKYRGELFVETLRLTSDETRKKKKCKFYVYKNAMDLLCSESELAVKVVGQAKRNASFKLDKSMMITTSSQVEFEHELYRVDSHRGVPLANSSSSELNNSVSVSGNVRKEDAKPASIFDKLFGIKSNESNNNTNPTKQPQPDLVPQTNLNELNKMLKSMILPKVQTQEMNFSEHSVTKIESGQINNNIDLDDQDEDDDDKSENIDKKTRIKKNLVNFCILIPVRAMSETQEKPTSANIDDFINEKNSIQILNDSCSKSNCNLEFEFRLKSTSENTSSVHVHVMANTSKKSMNKTFLSGCSINSDSEEEDESMGGVELNENGKIKEIKKKYKCKCLINGVKIGSSHSRTKSDAKRLASVRALKLLSKLFPVIQVNEILYQDGSSLNSGKEKCPEEQQSALATTSTNSTTTTKYIKITKEDLFNGSLASSIFASNSFSNSQTQQQQQQVPSGLGINYQ